MMPLSAALFPYGNIVYVLTSQEAWKEKKGQSFLKLSFKLLEKIISKFLCAEHMLNEKTREHILFGICYSSAAFVF